MEKRSWKKRGKEETIEREDSRTAECRRKKIRGFLVHRIEPGCSPIDRMQSGPPTGWSPEGVRKIDRSNVFFHRGRTSSNEPGNRSSRNREKNTGDSVASGIRSAHLLMGTPASWSARQPAHTVAMDDDPLLSVMVLSSRTTNGNSSSLGMTGESARSARFPCPISRRFAAPIRPVSPTLEGGKK